MSKLQRWKRRNWDKWDDQRFQITARKAMIIDNRNMVIKSNN